MPWLDLWVPFWELLCLLLFATVGARGAVLVAAWYHDSIQICEKYYVTTELVLRCQWYPNHITI